MTDTPPSPFDQPREEMPYDIVIVGGGVAGLSCAIRLKQLAQKNETDISVCILEKGSEIGAHILSGAVLEPRALDELLPDWAEKGAPLTTQVTKDQFYLLTDKRAVRLPTPPQMNNHGNYICSISNLTKWLAEQAEALGVEIFPGFAGAELLYDESGERVIGVATGDMGIGKDGQPTENFERGVSLLGKHSVFAEGAHGSLTKNLIEKFGLREGKEPQTYALGVKEIWEVPEDVHQEGLSLHSVGWPMDNKTYGGSWMYHAENNQISIGYVVALDYWNPWLSPFEEMQRFKTHPFIRKFLEGGKRISYGARALNEGGFQSIPKLTFPGGVLIGCAAGFLNVPKIKGNHTAMKSGMVAAEELFNNLDAPECTSYPDALEKSWVYKELKKERNIRPGFKWGLWPGMIHAAFQTIGGHLLPYTLAHHRDHESLITADKAPKIDYPKPDGVLTFDRLSSVYLSNTNHEEDQPAHLKLKDNTIPHEHYRLYAGPSQRYCPAGVYEFVDNAKGGKDFVINAQNCVHCKTCDIKDPKQNINWTVPQGGGGPNYIGM